MNKKIKNNKLDVLIYFITKALSGLLSFAVVSILTYMITPTIYGEYSLINGIISVLVSIFLGWLSSSTLRYYSDYKNQKEKYFSNVFADWVLMIILVSIILIVMSFVAVNINVKDYLIFCILLFLSEGTFNLFSSMLRATKDTLYYLFIVVGHYFLNIVFIITFVKILKFNLIGVFLAFIISYLIMCTFCIFHFKLFKYIKFSSISKIVQVKFLKYGLPMIGVWATSWVLNYSDRYLIKIYYSDTEVGLYDIGYKLAEYSINMLITSLSMAMMPILIDKYNEKGAEAAIEVHKKFLRYFFIAIIPASFGLIGIRSYIYGTLISSKYIPGMDTIIYIGISMLFYGFCQMIFKLWQLKEKTNMILLFMILSVIVNIILNIIFIPRYGFIVAAVTTLISNIITAIISFVLVKKEFTIKLDYIQIIKVLLSATLMYVFIYFAVKIPHKLILLPIIIIVAVVIYGISLSLLRGLDDEWIFIRKKFLKKRLK